MSDITTTPPVLDCCATCTHLTIGSSINVRARKSKNSWACEVHRVLLSGELRALRCDRWKRETREFSQVAEWEQMIEQGLKLSSEGAERR